MLFFYMRDHDHENLQRCTYAIYAVLYFFFRKYANYIFVSQIRIFYLNS